MSTSVYVHFPWCLQKCPYCDFASATIKRPEVPHAQYADAVLRELGWRRDDLGSRELASVFFGGGTPSLWDGSQLARVLEAIFAAFPRHAADLEITVECNPSSLDPQRAAALESAGVNRLSIGVQALDDARLRYLGRLHDADGALRAVEAAQRAVPRVSADLMFGTPGQRAEQFLSELARILELGLDHLSVYALTIEPDTQFGELQRKGKLPLAKEDDYADTFLAIERELGARGFEHYEVSNYARPGQSSRHNQHYWRGGDYLGLGAAAVGCMTGGPGRARRTRNQPKPDSYMRAQSLQELLDYAEDLDAQALVREGLLLGLRTAEGLNVSRLRARSGVDPAQGRERALARAAERGNLLREPSHWRVPQARWLHLDSIVADLF